MYRIRNPAYSKRDQRMRWALPDRIFLACGACHILAYAFLERHPRPDCGAVWIKPATGFIGNHVVVQGPGWVFDFHGYAESGAFLRHTWRRATHLWPGWDGSLVPLSPDILVSEAKSRAIEGLWLREPGQFLHDALPRARRFLDRFPAPPPAGCEDRPAPISAAS